MRSPIPLPERDDMAVTEQVLLQGAWYALEQAGRLLDDAVTLIDVGRFSTAIGVAMFGREELGRYRILRQLAIDVAKGRVMSVPDVQSRCEDHEDKQKAAILSTTLRPRPETRLGDAMQTQLTEQPGSPAWLAAKAISQSAFSALIKRMPADRHRLRMDSLYVDLEPNGSTWSRPSAISVEQARTAVVDAVNDYSVQLDRLLNVPGDAEMAAVVSTMNPAPDLVPPRRPKWI
jgi:AbiV family abortive infection protein